MRLHLPSLLHESQRQAGGPRDRSGKNRGHLGMLRTGRAIDELGAFGRASAAPSAYAVTCRQDKPGSEEYTVAGDPRDWFIRQHHDRRGIAVVEVPLSDELEQAPIKRQERQFLRGRTSGVRFLEGCLGTGFLRRINWGSRILRTTRCCQTSPERQDPQQPVPHMAMKQSHSGHVQGRPSVPSAPAVRT